jgi:DNA polymerase-3 subunit epsilon
VGGPKAWYLDVGDDVLEPELQFLRREIYGREDVEIPRRRFTAFDRYSSC